METDEVITEKIAKDSCNKSNEQVLNNEENNSASLIIENVLTSQSGEIKNNAFKTDQITNNCEMSLIEKNVTAQHCGYNDKDDTNNQQKESFNKLSVNNNERTNNSDNNKEVTNNLAIENLKQKNVDISVIHEKRNDKLSSLTSIAIEYENSDSETESTLDLNKQKNDITTVAKEMQTQPYRIINNESSSEESDDDSSSNTDCLVIIESNDSDSDDSTNKRNKGRNAKEQKNNEMKSELDDLPPIEDLKISVPEVLCDPFGEVAWMVEQLVVVQPKPGKPTLNLDTILFVDKGKRALGKIFDVFGQVKEPHYCVRFNSSKHIQECDIKIGMTVYYCPNTEYTSLVFLHELMKIKGIDANADEPPEFSDDEEERAYYEKLKQAKQASMMNEDVPFKRKRASSPNSSWQSNHPWNRNKQKNRKGYYPRGDPRQFSSAQGGNQLPNLWVLGQSNWPNAPGTLRPDSGESYGYGMYPSLLQSMQYVNSTMNNVNQNFYSSHNYYNEDGTTVPLNPRIPYNTSPRVHQEHLLFQNQSNSSPNLRFRNPNMTWQPQMSQNSETVNAPWISLPPPPPPPPPPSSPPSSPGTN
ncbi:uncharacterized protein LOC116426376 isoform X2 [Nomia melanderi]|uniref:uncharacterized protein LOC116426376 isoform X2 n=1 Tax=Nomia melanderi TaxID=2448451 RepID=UPI001304055A|nr:H/ACA ribonucleoprotein complex non-core subunit NAF1 isoform X2 [Nomia melanderi]